MRRQTILLAAALAVAMPATAAISQNRNEATASRHPASPTGRDRLILMIKDAKTAAFSIAPSDEATTFGLAKTPAPDVAPAAADPAPQLGAEMKPFAAVAEDRADFTAPDMSGYAQHVRLAPVYAFEEPRIGNVSLNVGPVLTTSYREGEARPGGEVYGTGFSGVAVGLSFKLN